MSSKHRCRRLFPSSAQSARFKSINHPLQKKKEIPQYPDYHFRSYLRCSGDIRNFRNFGKILEVFMTFWKSEYHNSGTEKRAWRLIKGSKKKRDGSIWWVQKKKKKRESDLDNKKCDYLLIVIVQWLKIDDIYSINRMNRLSH
jgi:hypothetical protein